MSAWHDAGCSTVRGEEASGAGGDVQRELGNEVASVGKACMFTHGRVSR